jgi:hypothetical protein
MSMASLEREILAEAKDVFKNQKLTKNKIIEWSTGDVKAQDGEVAAYLPKIGVTICIALADDKRLRSE